MRGIQRYWNVARGRDTGPQSGSQKSAMGMDVPALSGPMFQTLATRGKLNPPIGCGSPDEVEIGRLTRPRCHVCGGTSRVDLKCALVILSGSNEL